MTNADLAGRIFGWFVSYGWWAFVAMTPVLAFALWRERKRTRGYHEVFKRAEGLQPQRRPYESDDEFRARLKAGRPS